VVVTGKTGKWGLEAQKSKE